MRQWATAVIAGLAVILCGLATATDASAAPGAPGVPQPGTVVLLEDFENQSSSPAGIPLSSYIGASGSGYAADPYWLPAAQHCNGWIMNSTTPNAPITTVDAGCNVGVSLANIRNMANSLGLLQGQAPGVAATNQAIGQMTQGGVAATGVQLQTTAPITSGIAAGGFYQASVDVAAVNCFATGPSTGLSIIENQTGSGPAPGTGTGTVVPVAGPVAACTDPSFTTLGGIRVGRITSPVFRLSAGVSSLGIQVTDAYLNGVGNDHAFDRVRLVNVTPQLDKAFAEPVVNTGDPVGLTFTITNTDDLLSKPGWSFSDALPTGLTATGGGTTTCPAGAVTAVAGSGIVSASGNLTAGLASCTVTVEVTAVAAGVYTNQPTAVTLSGLNAPASAAVVFASPTIQVSKTLAARADPSDQFGVALRGPAGVTLATAETTGTDLAAESDAAPAVQGSTYTITEAALAGSANGLDAYDSTASCTNTETGGVIPLAGSGPSWTFVPTTLDPYTCTVNNAPLARSFSLVKAAGQATAQPGDVVDYTITVTNLGDVPFTTTSPARVTDTLTGVLDDASYNDDASPAAALVGDQLSWALSLAVGETVTLTLSVTVGPLGAGDGAMTNTVGGGLAQCDACTAVTQVIAPPPAPPDGGDDSDTSELANSGVPPQMSDVLFAGLGLIGFGVIATVRARHYDQRQVRRGSTP